MKRTDQQGIVYLVGAGPGDPDLITVRGEYILGRCDAVVYDNLIPDELVTALPAETERWYVGKEAGRHSLPQNEINNLLVKLSSEGKRVVRLKGGDPFVFGRGGEEAAHLRDHGIPFEIIPGVTSGVAAPAFAGIPCTARSDASYVLFLSGHKAADKATSTVPWEWVGGVKNGTLVVYMGVAEAKNIVEKLLAGGMDPDTPAAVLERGTMSTQRAVTTTLSSLPDEIAGAGVKSPAILVIGDVVKYHGELRWFHEKPLSGVRVMVTRPADQSAPLYRSLRESGAEVLAYPTIETAEVFDTGVWNEVRSITNDERWVVFTSENGVRYFLAQWPRAVGDIRRLGAYRVAAVGDGTLRALERAHIVPDFVPGETTMAALADELTGRVDLAEAAVVRVRGNLGDDRIEKTVERAGACVFALPVYRTGTSKWPAQMTEKLFAHPPHAIFFSSGAAAEGLAENLDAGQLERLTGGAAIVSVGPSTTRALESHGLRVDHESKERTVAAIVDELIAWHEEAPLNQRP
jgi:uroporphyrinogen III methyltransferase/synthase